MKQNLPKRTSATNPRHFNDTNHFAGLAVRAARAGERVTI